MWLSVIESGQVFAQENILLRFPFNRGNPEIRRVRYSQTGENDITEDDSKLRVRTVNLIFIGERD